MWNPLADIERKLDMVLDQLHALRSAFVQYQRVNNEIGERIMADLSELQADVEANGEVVTSAITLIEGLADRLDNIDPTDPAAITALAAELRSQSDSLATAVAANTPVDTGGGDTGGGVTGGGDTPPVS